MTKKEFALVGLVLTGLAIGLTAFYAVATILPIVCLIAGLIGLVAIMDVIGFWPTIAVLLLAILLWLQLPKRIQKLSAYALPCKWW